MAWYYDSEPLSLEQKKAKALRYLKRIGKGNSAALKPAVAKGRNIATSFWGQSWNRNLERYQDYENRLPRGRSYLRNGFVLDLQVEKGVIKAIVCGSEVYEVIIRIKPLEAGRWRGLKQECSGQIASLVALLQGKLPPTVMEAVTRQDEGLFPEPRDIRFSCTCPDDAELCKHAAAAAYGVGARLDEEPHLLFLLRGVDHHELMTGAANAVATQASHSPEETKLDDLGDIFGIDLEAPAFEAPPAPAPPIKISAAQSRRSAKSSRKPRARND